MTLLRDLVRTAAEAPLFCLLARSGSPWARARYRNNREKRLRAVARYRPTSAHERHRQRVLDAIGGTLPELAAASASPSAAERARGTH